MASLSKPGVISENINSNSIAIGNFFEFFDAKIQNDLFIIVHIFADHKIMLNRPAEQATFVFYLFREPVT